MGNFCNRFHDDEDSDDEEDEDGNDNPKSSASKMTGHSRTKGNKLRKVSKKQAKGNTSAALKWAQHLSPANVPVKVRGGQEVMQQVIQLKVNNQPNLTPAMMSSVNQLTKVHTIEIVKCQREEIPPDLKELEIFTVLRMSHNHLRRFAEELAKCSKLEKIILDWNDIGDIQAGIFSKRNFPNLEVVNLAHNALVYLPNDFGITSKGGIKLIDLSYNQIQSIPNSILQCKHLQELNLSHNNLKVLPDNFAFQKLEKLFLSFNNLVKLPSNIGECRQLSKIRLIDNKLKELPPSILNLWKQKKYKDAEGKVRTGMLEELLVDRNPLQIPSITAFEMDKGMAGVDRAFHLFDEYLLDLRKSEAETKALEDRRKEQKMLQAPVADDAPEALDLANHYASEDATPATEADNAEAPSIPASWKEYYFAAFSEDEITNIRDAESTLLMLKKNRYLDKERKLAELALAAGGPDNVAATLRPFLDDNYRENFNGLIPVKDIDLYFNLLVFGVKSQYPAIHVLFDKIDTGDKGHILREEFDEFCKSIPVSLADDIRDQMWQLMAYRQPDMVFRVDFVAAWHIHDIESRDPWIVRLTEVLQLDYYDMTPSELQIRLRAKDSATATPQLDLNAGEFGQDKQESQWNKSRLDNQEGLKRVAPERLDDEDEVVANVGGRPTREQVLNKVSLSDRQYEVYREEVDSNDGDSEASVYSQELSESGSEGSDISEFDAQVFVKQLADLHEEESSQMTVAGKFVVDSDAAMKKLMEMPRAEFFRAQQKMEATKVKSIQSPLTRPSRRLKALDRKDDLFTVRQAIRQVHRTMPFSDFISLINYLLRALQTIKLSMSAVVTDSLQVTYWHVDDPIFRHTMGAEGTHRYTQKLLVKMGFVKLGGLNWVWPAAHLDLGKGNRGLPSWGIAAVSADCPGRHSGRLAEMIRLLKSCQLGIVHSKAGGSFTGHFPLLR
mmetsp:Transcript_117993/g.252007  ORF Transcript_117993/g.252007 Transcript_117993/m.252007 type:complete len:952 (+) Transcript_117993:121-2976(+)